MFYYEMNLIIVDSAESYVFNLYFTFILEKAVFINTQAAGIGFYAAATEDKADQVSLFK